MSRVTALFVVGLLGWISSSGASAACDCGNGHVQKEGTCTGTAYFTDGGKKTIRATSSETKKCSLITYQLGDTDTSTTVPPGQHVDDKNDSSATSISNIRCQVCYQ